MANRTTQQNYNSPVFVDLYESLKQDRVDVDDGLYVEPRLTLSAEGIPLVHFLRWVSDQAGVSVIAESSLDTNLVSVDVVDVPVSQLLGSVARRFNVAVTRTGNVFFLGKVRAQDRGILVRKVNRLSGEELQNAISTLISETGRALAFSDGVVVVADTVEVLAKVSELLDGIEAAPIDGWVVQYYIVAISDTASRELGLDVVPALDLAASLSAVTSGDTTRAASASAALTAILRADATTEGVGIEAQPMFLLVDGATGKHTDAERIPVVLRTTVENGTTFADDIEYIDIGIVVEVSLREVGSDRALVTTNIDLSSLTGFVENVPTSRGQQYQTISVIESAGVYLLGEMTRTNDREGTEGILGLVQVESASRQTIQVWCRAYRVKGDVKQQQPKPDGRTDPDATVGRRPGLGVRTGTAQDLLYRDIEPVATQIIDLYAPGGTQWPHP